MGKLLRAVEQYGHRSPELQRRGLKLRVSGEDSISPSEAVVYVVHVPSPQQTAKAAAADKYAPSFPPLVRKAGVDPRKAMLDATEAQVKEWRQTVANTKHARETKTGDIDKFLKKPFDFQAAKLSRDVNEEFKKLLPHWHNTLNAKIKGIPRKGGLLEVDHQLILCHLWRQKTSMRMLKLVKTKIRSSCASRSTTS